MPEKQLDRSQVETFGEPPAGRLVPQVMPVQVDIGELLTVHAAVRARARRLNAVREQNERLPGGPNGALIFAVLTAEHVRLRTDKTTTLQKPRQAAWDRASAMSSASR